MTHIEEKLAVFTETELALKHRGFEIEKVDLERPWGGFFVIKEAQAGLFADMYFEGEPFDDLIGNRRVSPKILIIAPGKRLSWQYHHRRSEVWAVIAGKVGVIRSKTDNEGPLVTLQKGDKVVLAKGERHRLVGLNDFGIVAEIWQHTDPGHPSDEADIVRLQDDYGRDQ